MRILFAGTPEIAVPSLEKLAGNFTVCGVLTNPDRVKGRGKKLLPPPVKTKALELGIPVLQFSTLKGDAREAVQELAPELLVVYAYGIIFGDKFLSLFPYGGLNVHPSLLPKYRGSSPLISAILAGDAETGVTVQKVAREMDTGDIVKQIVYPLSGTETTASLSEWAAEQGASLLFEAVTDMESGKLVSHPQKNEEATYCSKITKEDGRINWMENAGLIERKIRAFTPWPGSFTSFRDKKLNIITAYHGTAYKNSSESPGKVIGVDKMKGILVQTGSGVLGVTSLQLQSKKVLDWKTFINGTPQIIGSILGGSQ